LPAFDAVPRLATVSPMITYYDQPGRLWFAGATYARQIGVSRHRFLAKPLSTADSVLGRLFATDYVPNCAAMTPRKVYEDIGLLDERFFLGQEDVDWGIRLRQAGYEARVVGRPLVAHKVSLSAGVRGSNVLSPAQAYHYARGSMLIAAKWVRGLNLATYLCGQLLVRLPYYSAQAARHNRWASIPAYLRGLWDGYRLYLIRRATRPSR
jgi:GT2 family glycosyltransferase